MGDILLSIALFFVGFAALFIAGLPVAQLVLFADGKALDTPGKRDGLWAASLFVGYGVITVLLKLTTALDVPVKYAAWPVFIILLAVFAAWVWFTYRKKPLPALIRKAQLPVSIAPPRMFILLLAAVALLFSIPYFVIGATHYRGYGWWDLFTFGAQAELFRDVPFSQFAALGETQPYASVINNIFGGVHRMSRALYQAFVAGICGADGAATLGFLSLLTLVMAFCALVYATKDLPMKPLHRYAACFFGSCVPGLVVNQLEGFLPVGLFTGIAIFCCKLFCDLFEKTTFAKSILCGALLSTFVTTMQDGTLLLLGLLAVSAAAVFLFKDTSLGGLGRTALHAAVAVALMVALNLPYLRQIMAELGTSMVRTQLNYIYDWPLLPDGLTWTFFGSFLGDIPGFAALVLRVAATLLYGMGLYGILHGFLAQKRLESLNFTALLVVPFVFLCMGESLPYAFFKTFTFGMPLVVLGVWQFWGLVREMLAVRLFVSAKPVAAKVCGVVLPAVSVCLTLAFLATTALSFQKVMLILGENVPSGIREDRRTYQIVEGGASHPAAWPHYDAMAQRTGQDVLLVSGASDLFYWWMAYYGRYNNTIYSLVPAQNEAYSGGKTLAREDWRNIPLDVEIVYAPPHSFGDILVDEAYRGEAAALLEGQNEDESYTIIRWPEPDFVYEDFRLTAFTKTARDAVLEITVGEIEAEDAALWVDGETYPVTSGGTVEIPLHLPQGGSEILIEGTDGVELLVTGQYLRFLS